jgi:hypothetical protein
LKIGDAYFGITFHDSYQVLQSTECYSSNEISKITLLECNYLYGSSLIAILEFFNIYSEFTIYVGSFFYLANLIIFSLLTSRIYLKFGLKRALLGVTIFISPPFHYLIERGNFDSLIIILLLIASHLMEKKLFTSSHFFLGIASLFKFYTLPVQSLLLFFLKLKMIKINLYHFLIFNIVMILVLYDLSNLFSTLKSGTGGYGGTFGLRSFALYLIHMSKNFDYNITYFLNYAFFFLTLLFVVSRYRFKNLLPQNYDSWGLNIMLIFGSQIVFIYIFTMNNDYRLSFLGVFLAAFLQHDYLNIKFKRFVLVSGILALWLSYPTWIFQVLGDFILFLNIIFIILFLVTIVSTGPKRSGINGG